MCVKRFSLIFIFLSLFLAHSFTESNLMGAAEWTGYSSPTVASSYPTSFQATSYDQSSMLPAVLPSDTYNPNDYHCGSSVAQNASYGTTTSQFAPLTPWPNEVDQYNYGYNSYQYPCQPASTVQTQYPPPPPPAPPSQTQPTMVLYPQLYSTVNQNQIHLHLHGSEKFVEHYLGSTVGSMPADNSFSLSHNSRAIGNGLELPMLSQAEAELKQQEQAVDQDSIGDPNVWRPHLM
jgi:hypothetical protein